jgi:PTS system beta-glucosides-specific IIC component
VNTTNEKSRKGNIFNKVMETISGIFLPIINVLMAAGLLKGILMIVSNLGLLTSTDGAYQILYAISDGLFCFLPIFLAFSAAKKLKADQFTSVLIAAALLYPDITSRFGSGAGLDLFGLPVSPVKYPYSVIPIILTVWLQHFIEIPLEKYLPTIVKGFLKPLITAILTTPAAFLVFGPLGSLIGKGCADAYAVFYGLSPILAGSIFGLIWQPMVVLGLHWGVIPVMIDHINTLGVDTILPLTGPSVMGQVGAALAVSIMTKNRKLKGTAMSASVTGLFGITEPILFGVSIPLKRPMAAACIAGAVGGIVAGASGNMAVAFVFPSVISLMAFWGKGFIGFLLAMLISFVLGFVLTFLFRFKDPENEAEIS